MLRGASNKSSKRITRRKSTLSVNCHRDYIDPEVSRQHAHAAAALAFARGQERLSAEMTRNGAVVRGQSSMERQNQRPSPNQECQEQPVHVGEHTVRRQQSVRFAGPNAVRRERSTGTRKHVDQKQSSVSLRPRALTNDVPVPAEFRPPSRSSSIGKASIRGDKSGSFTTVMAAYDEYYTKEDDIASTPSSYRRIRRSRSMLSPLKKVPSIFFHNGTPESHHVSERTPSRPAHPRLLSVKSMSFLKSRRDSLTHSRRESHDQAVQIARDRYLHDIEQQRLRAQPSFIFRARSQREEKPFRKSLRSSSANSWGLPVASANQSEQYKAGSLRRKARNASQSIKNTLKGLFRRNVSESVHEPLIGSQQIKARSLHSSQLSVGPTEVVQSDYNNIPLPDLATVSRVASRVPSLHTIPSAQQLRSGTGSVRSLRSEGSGTTTKSRVTSWTSTQRDDPTVNSTSSRHAMMIAEKERQRLSIIQENGTHISSASGRRRPIKGQFPVPAHNQFSAFPSFHHHRHAGSSIETSGNPQQSEQAPRVVPSVDSQRVYSALMKRLDENSPKAKLAQQMTGAESFGPPPPHHIPLRCSSINNLNGSFKIDAGTPSTIRHVDEENRTLPVMATEQEWISTTHGYNRSNCDMLDDVFSPSAPLQARDAVGGKQSVNGSSRSTASTTSHKGVVSRAASYSAYPLATIGDTKARFSKSFTPQELALLNETKKGNRVPPPLPQRRILQQRGSGLFGTSFRTLKCTTSPYRRALAQGDCSPVRVDENPIDSPGPTLIGPLGDIKASESTYLQIPVAYTESIYSRTTSGRSPSAAESVEDYILSNVTNYSHNFASNANANANATPRDECSTGDAIILVDRATYKPKTPTYHHRKSSNTTTEAEFKSWMVKQVEGFEMAERKDVGGSVANASNTYDKTAANSAGISNAQIRAKSVKAAVLSGASINYAMPTMPRAFGHSHCHVREHAQIHDDDVHVAEAQNKVVEVRQPVRMVHQEQPSHPPQPPPLRPILKNRTSNPSIDISPPVQMHIPIPPPPPIPDRSTLRYSMSRTSLRSVKSMKSSKSAASERSFVALKKKRKDFSTANAPAMTTHGPAPPGTLVNKISNTTLRSINTPNKLVKKDRRPSGLEIGKISPHTASLASPCPGDILATVQRKFGSAGSGNLYSTPYGGSSYGYSGRENESPRGFEDGAGDHDEDIYGVQGTGLMGPGWGGAFGIATHTDYNTGGYGSKRHESFNKISDAQVMGSQRMVDMFLSSRRRRIEGSEDSGPHIGAGGAAFI